MATQHTSTLPTDSAKGGGGSSLTPWVTKLPDQVQPEVRDLIASFQEYKASTDWDRIDETTRALDADAVYDSPFMYISGGRDRVRAVAKLIAPFAYTEFTPKLVRVLMNTAERKAEMEVDGTLAVVPRKYWFLPATWLLPSRVPIEGTVTLHVKSWNDKVSRVQERFWNLPTVLPVAVRFLIGWAVGTAGVLAEPALRTLYNWYSQGYATVEGGVQSAMQNPTVASAVDKTEGLGTKVAEGVGAVKGKVAGLVSE